MKKRIALAIVPLIVVPLAIGGGFALFIFDKGAASEEQPVSIKIENANDWGELTLVYKDGTSYVDESTNSDLYSCVRLGYQNVLMTRSDNPTKARNFIIQYDHPTANEYDGDALNLYCEIEISDTDAKGVTIETIEDSKIYAKSNSIVDIFKPTSITYKEEGATANTLSSFSLKEELTTSSTYVCKIASITPTLGADTVYYDLAMSFEFLSYKATLNGTEYTGTLAPIHSFSYEAYMAKLQANIAACENSNVNVRFYLDK